MLTLYFNDFILQYNTAIEYHAQTIIFCQSAKDVIEPDVSNVLILPQTKIILNKDASGNIVIPTNIDPNEEEDIYGDGLEYFSIPTKELKSIEYK
jgi:hypothetical protein|tara:strand:+ start:943 stop:1227 length:285 start_codon:yes stop_codon:yes gene_type:complete